jgi:hypothetical protein
MTANTTAPEPEGAGRTGELTHRAALSRELQPVFAVAFLVVVARGTLASTELAMAVMAMSAAFGVFCRPQVPYWNFVGFAHITFLQCCLGCVSCAKYFFRFDQLTTKI